MSARLSLSRRGSRASWPLYSLATAFLALLAWGCAEKITAPPPPQVEETPMGRVAVFADAGPSAGVTTLVIQVSGPGIVKANNGPDTLSFNITLNSSGVASGSIAIPAGSARVIMAHAYTGLVESHRGSITTNILEGVNPTLAITLVPLVGTTPITVSIGSTIVTIRPGVASLTVGDTLRMTSEIRDQNGVLVTGNVRWATLNPVKAQVDTNGLVTMRDTGNVQIVGTYGTVGGAATLTGALAASTAAVHLTWNGSVSTSWQDPNNWTPHGIGAARVPTLADSVVIPSGPSRMPVVSGATFCAEQAVRDLIIQQGATLGTSCSALSVYGTADVRGTITVDLYMRPNSKLGGTYKNVYVYGNNVSMTDSVRAQYFQVNIPVGTFVMAGHTLRTTNDFDVDDGTVTMAAGDTLMIGGNGYWAGDDETGLMTGGVVYVRGTSFYGYQYFGTGTNRLVFDRTATGLQTISGFDYVSSPTRNSIRKLDIRNRDGVTICAHMRVTDTLSYASTGTPSAMGTCSSYQIRADGPVITSANTDVATYLWQLFDATGTSLVSGTWHPTYTDFDVTDGIIKSTLAYGNMRFFASNKFLANTSATGFLYVDGAAVELTLNGKKAVFGNYLDMEHGAVLKMLNAADSLMIGEYASFDFDNSVAQKPLLTAGVLSVGAYLDGYGLSASATGTFKVVLTGASASTSKYITRVNFGSRSTQALYDLEIAAGATYGLCEQVRVTHNVTVRAGATLQEWCGGSNYLDVLGDLIGDVGSTIKPYVMMIHNPTGTSNVLGAFSPVYTEYFLTDAPVKANLAYQHLYFYASNHLLGATTTTGVLWIEGTGVDLAINGQTVNVGDYLQLQSGGTLTMTNTADVVNVGNYVSFNWDASTVENPKLTAGMLRVGGYFDGYGFSASGTHTVELTMTNPSTSRYITRVNYSTRPAQAFQNLNIAAGATYGLCEFVAVKGTITVAATATLQEWCGSSNHLRIDNNLVAPAGSTVKPYEVLLNNTVGTQNVSGTFTPVYTSLLTTAATGQLKAGLGYQHLQLFATASLAGNLSVAGDLLLSGAAAILTLNGKTLTVAGTLTLQTNATLIMNNAADVLDLSGPINWNGGGSEAGKLTAGTTIVRGATFCATNYETSGTHKTVFDRPATPVKVQCVSSGGTTQQMYDVDVKNAGVSVECYMNVTHDVHVFSPATVNETCSGGTLWVGHSLLTDAGSAVTNGPSYPSTTKLSVVLYDPLGTQNVGGAYSADGTYFLGLNAFIKPTLPSNSMDYKYVRIDQSTVFQDSTEIDGQLDLINSSIVSLDGPAGQGVTVVVKGVLNFDNTARLKMTVARDTMIAALADPTADLFWDGGDNSTDGVAANDLLTNGAVKYYGDRLYGLQYNARPGSRHRFIFMSSGTGNVSLDGAPSFAQMEIRGTRPVVNTGNTVVNDSLMMGVSTSLGGTSGYMDVLGAVVTSPASDIAVRDFYVDGNNGTKDVAGAFHPTNTYFRAVTPVATALKPGLNYQSVFIQGGPYTLSGATAFGNSSAINVAAGNLNLNGQTLTVTGNFDVNTNGILTMANASDALTATGIVTFSGGASSTVLSAGTITESGGFNNSMTGLNATGSHKVVASGTSAQSISTGGSGGRALRNLDITCTCTVTLASGGVLVTDKMRVLSTATVSGSTSTVVTGVLSSIAGSTFNTSSLDLADPSGTSAVLGNLAVSGTMTFSGAGQSIRVATGVSYANMTISGSSSVSSGNLTVPGTLTLSASATLSLPVGAPLTTAQLTMATGSSMTVPTGSAVTAGTIAGTVSFAGTNLSTTGVLTVQSGGHANAPSLTATDFIDFKTITINSGGFLDNNISRSSGQGGFRFLTVGGNFTNGNGGTTNITGPVPIGH